IYPYNTGYLDVESLQKIDDVYKDKFFRKRNNLSQEIYQKVQEFESERQRIEKRYSWLQKVKKPIENFKKEKRLQQLKTRFEVVDL
ncbi:MAG: hypothetical protein WBM32_01705, partial [Crocosphaera sp.]